mgnify:FL=1
MMSVIKSKIKSLRTNTIAMIPKFFKFWKFIFVGIISGLIWLLYLIGAAVDIIISILKLAKTKTKEEDVQRNTMER